MLVRAPLEALPLPAVDQLPVGIAVAPLLVQEDALLMVQVKLEEPPLVTVEGLGTIEQVGAGVDWVTVTFALHVFVPPGPVQFRP